MGQQCRHAELCIGGHRADSRGQLGAALGIHGQHFKQLLPDLITHGIRNKHHYALSCSADIFAVKMRLPLRLEAGQITGQALAPAYCQRIKEIVRVDLFYQ